MNESANANAGAHGAHGLGRGSAGGRGPIGECAVREVTVRELILRRLAVVGWGSLVLGLAAAVNIRLDWWGK